MFGRSKKNGKGRRGGHLRLLFATDLHAGERTYRKFLNAAPVYEADILILGGDLTGKVVAPIVEKDGRFTATRIGTPVTVDADGLDELEKSFRELGFYPIRLSPDEYERITEDEEYKAERIDELLEEQVARWMALAAERLDGSGIPLFVTGGNDDPMSMEPILDQATYAQNAESKVLRIAEDCEMASTGYGNPTPWVCPRDIPEEELGQRIETMLEGVESMESSIFNFHVPPFDTSLDIAPKLDDSVTPPAAIPGETAPVGSVSVLEAIKEHQPMLSLHGHIHESRGIVNVGRTVCINPGSEYAEGVLRAAVVDIRDGEVINAQLVAG